MTPTISTLRSWQLDDLNRAARIASANAGKITTAARRVDKAFVNTVRWTGAAQSSAKRAVAADTDDATEVSATLFSVASAAANAAREMIPARSRVFEEVAAAVTDGFLVSDTGDVRPSPDDNSDDDPATRESNARIWTNRIQLALIAVGELDARYSRTLRTLADDLTLMARGQPQITLPDGSRSDPDAVVAALAVMTPAQRQAFVERLSPEAIRALVIADPDTVGKLHGVPLPVRFAANEITLRTALATEIADGRGDGARAHKLTEMLTPVAPANPRPGDPGTPVARKFLYFSNTDLGRSVEMVGELDAGTQAAVVYVPGTGTNLNNSSSNTQAARDLARRTGAPVFVYLDDRLPQSLPAAADGAPARAMAPDLVALGRDIDAELARVAPHAKTTFIGHSYGGVVVGTAEQMGLRADNVIYASSAGSGAYEGGWHNANAHVARYSLTAPGDPIALVQNSGVYGGDPDSAPGVTRMDTGYYADHGAAGHGAPVAGTSGHGNYWNDPDSTAFANMVAVITGDEPTKYVPRAPDVDLAALAATGQKSATDSVAQQWRQWFG